MYNSLSTICVGCTPRLVDEEVKSGYDIRYLSCPRCGRKTTEVLFNKKLLYRSR